MPRDIGYIVRKRAFKGTRGGTRVSLSIFRSMDQLRDRSAIDFGRSAKALRTTAAKGREWNGRVQA